MFLKVMKYFLVKINTDSVKDVLRRFDKFFLISNIIFYRKLGKNLKRVMRILIVSENIMAYLEKTTIK
jgi:hypothetical protein